MSPNAKIGWDRNERGQTTIALAGVLVVALGLVWAIAAVGHAAAHRALARTAADASALAEAIDPGTGQEVRAYYAQVGIHVDQVDDRATAFSGPSQAASWAVRSEPAGLPAPALVAIVARAEQLVGVPFSAIRWDTLEIALPGDEAHVMRIVAPELGLCEMAPAPEATDWWVFRLC